VGTAVKIALGIVLGFVVLIIGCGALIAVGTSVPGGSGSGAESILDGGSSEKPKGRAKTLRFSGNGGKNLGTIKLPKDSRLTWTNDGDLFTVMDEELGFSVNSQGKRGSSEVEAGTYRKVGVNAIGNWTMTIKPR